MLIEPDIMGNIEFAMELTSNQMSSAYEHSQLPPGFRFHPTDEELVSYCLTNKILDSTFSSCAVAEVDLNKCEPWDLPAKAKIGKKEWYFFSHTDRKYPRGLRTNRTTETGYWKTVGRDREVFSSGSSTLIGMKKTLVFYKGRAPKGERTNWATHEYRLQGKFSCHPLHKNCKDKWVVCRVFKKSAIRKMSSIGLTRSQAYSDLLGSPRFPSLLESPCNMTAENDQQTRSFERKSVTSANPHDVSCFSIPMEPTTNLTEHHLPQIQCCSNYPDSYDQLSETAGFMEESSYIHNPMLNDKRIYTNKIPRAPHFSAPSIRRDQISAKLDQQPGIQLLPVLRPPILYNPHMPIPSNHSNLGFSTNPYLPSLHSSNVVSKVLVDQSAGIPMGPFSSSCAHHKTLSNNSTMGSNISAKSLQWTTDGLCQNILAQPIQESDGAMCLSSYINHEMTSVVCNPLDTLDSSSATPVDLHSLRNNREHLF